MVFSWFCVKCPSSGWLFPHHFLPTPAGHDQFFQVTGGENAPPDPGTTDGEKGISIGALRLGGSNLVPLVNIKIAGKWMFIPLKMVLIGIDP